MLRTFAAALALFFFALVSSCASTKLTGVWNDSALAAVHIDRVLVFVADTDATARRQLEDRLVVELREAGQDANPSYRAVQDASLATQDDVLNAAWNHGYDAVLVARYVGYETKPEQNAAAWMHDYAASIESYAGSQGRIYDTVKVRSDLYLLKGAGDLVWSGVAETYDPGTWNAAAIKLARKLVSKMDQDLAL